jgi:hypothetical protein
MQRSIKHLPALGGKPTEMAELGGVSAPGDVCLLGMTPSLCQQPSACLFPGRGP